MADTDTGADTDVDTDSDSDTDTDTDIDTDTVSATDTETETESETETNTAAGFDCTPTSDDPAVACAWPNDCCEFPEPIEDQSYSMGEDFCHASWVAVFCTMFIVDCENLGSESAYCTCYELCG
jgi:hypothetical protein